MMQMSSSLEFLKFFEILIVISNVLFILDFFLTQSVFLVGESIIFPNGSVPVLADIRRRNLVAPTRTLPQPGLAKYHRLRLRPSLT